VFIPVSVLFIKYYPQWGRAFDAWSGMPTNCGITTNKNALGCDCFILGFFLIWHCQRMWRHEKGLPRRNELVLCLFLLGLIGWLLEMAQSATALGALVLAVAAMWFLGLKFVDRRRLGVYVWAGVVICALAEVFFGIHNYAIHALGRNSTLTDRITIWQILLHWDLNPVFGVGFESFWLGGRLDKFAELFRGITINEAHNGYLETYINLGLLGVFLTLVMVLAAYFKSQRTLVNDFDFGRFRLAYLAAFIVYNWTEAGFRTHCFPFFMFFLIAVDYPALKDLSGQSLTPVETETDNRMGNCPQNRLAAISPGV